MKGKKEMSFQQTRSSKGKIFFVSLLSWVAVLGVPTLQAQIITTVAGNGTQGFSGDEDLATGAMLHGPHGVAIDGAGNLFIADLDNNRIRRVDGVTGIITTVAGNGLGYGGYSGDGGPATDAQLFFPFAVAVDGAGNLFIADWFNHRIRRVDGVTGIIITVAGNGLPGYSGDGGPGGGAQLDHPEGVAVDASGNLYIADTFNNRIRFVDGVTGIITTVVGNGTPGYSGDWNFSGDPTPPTSAQLDGPTGVALDASGNLYIADWGNHCIRLVGFYFITTWVAGLNHPRSVAVDGAFNLFIADEDNQRIRRKDGVTGIISTVAGNGVYGFCCDGAPATSAQLNFPEGVAVDASNNLFIADTSNHRIRKVAPAP